MIIVQQRGIEFGELLGSVSLGALGYHPVLDASTGVLYVPTTSSRFLSVDVSTPTALGSPSQLIDAGLDASRPRVVVDAARDLTFVTASTPANRSVAAIDITTPSAMSVEDNLAGPPDYDVEIAIDRAGDRVFVEGVAGTVERIDTSTPTTLANTGSAAVDCAAGLAYHVGDDRVFAVSETTVQAVTAATMLATGTPYTIAAGREFYAARAVLDEPNDHLFVAYTNTSGFAGGVMILDVSTASPTLVGEIATTNRPRDLALDAAGNRLFAAAEINSPAGIYVIDVSTRSLPALSSTIAVGSSFVGVEHDASNDVVLAGVTSSSLRAYNVAP